MWQPHEGPVDPQQRGAGCGRLRQQHLGPRVALPTRRLPSQACGCRTGSCGDVQDDLGAEHPLQGGVLQELGAPEPDAVSAEVQVPQGPVVEEHGGQGWAADGSELALLQPAGGKQAAAERRPAELFTARKAYCGRNTSFPSE